MCVVATMLSLFIMRDRRRHLPADRASFGERPEDNSPRAEVMQACAHQGPL
jgi:hypothetical protein